MKMLERYNKLSKEDKSYLESFIIYREIYDNAKAKNIELSDDTVEDLKEYIMEFHDDYYNYDLSQMTNFISINYLNNKFTLRQLQNFDKEDLYDALEENNIEMLIENYERQGIIMDFSKLNVEFSNMQKTVTKYTEIIVLVNLKVKDNLKSISKYETKMKNTKNKIEKDIAHLYITMLKCENEFLESLVKEQEDKNEKGV